MLYRSKIPVTIEDDHEVHVPENPKKKSEEDNGVKTSKDEDCCECAHDQDCAYNEYLVKSG